VPSPRDDEHATGRIDVERQSGHRELPVISIRADLMVPDIRLDRVNGDLSRSQAAVS
jgi:hypothetical protein